MGRKKKKSKYKKIKLKLWRCDDCGFEQAYETIRCPLCSNEDMTKIK